MAMRSKPTLQIGTAIQPHRVRPRTGNAPKFALPHRDCGPLHLSPDIKQWGVQGEKRTGEDGAQSYEI